ncbi:MAG: FtsX-like permease family protein [Planctomycetaceae bacterium]
MSRTLDRKLRRDLRAMRGPATAIALILACGVAVFVCVLTARQGLRDSRDATFAAYRMADLYAPVRRAPRALTRSLERVEGVRRVEARLVEEVTVDLPGLAAPCSARVVSVDLGRDLAMHALHLVEGAWFDGDGDRQVIVADRFAKHHGLARGDRLLVVLNNRKEALRVVGTAFSPEYVYMLRGGGELLPDPERFTVLWIATPFAESVFDAREACNEFTALLEPGASLPRIIAEFDRILDRHGALGAYGRADQLGTRFLNDEIAGLKGMATIVPAVFLGVAAFVLRMLLARLVQTQRGQVALFRATGYAPKQIAGHYLKLALLIGGAGALLGAGVGLWFSRWVLRMYGIFYQFPILEFPVDPWILLGGAGASVAAATTGALGAALRAAHLLPAEGLRPEAPRAFRRTLLERWRAVWTRLGFVERLILRNVTRQRRRTAATVAGVAVACSILVLADMMQDSMEVLLDHQFRRVELQDARVAFESERGTGSLHELRRLPGVRDAELELTVPVRLVRGRRERRTAITGLAAGQRLRALLDAQDRAVPPPRDGLVLSRNLAERLDVRPGEELEVRFLRGARRIARVTVERVVEEYLGSFAYAGADALARWMGEGEVATGALLLVDSARAAEVGRALKTVPAVASVVFKGQVVESFRATLAASQDIMLGVIRLFAGIIAFGVIYNASRIALAERERELGTLRMLGFRRREVAALLFGENLLLALLALPFGLGLGALFGAALVRAYASDLYRLPFAFEPSTALRASLLVLLFTLLAELAVRRRLFGLDLVETLKTRE